MSLSYRSVIVRFSHWVLVCLTEILNWVSSYRTILVSLSHRSVIASSSRHRSVVSLPLWSVIVSLSHWCVVVSLPHRDASLSLSPKRLISLTGQNVVVSFSHQFLRVCLAEYSLRFRRCYKFCLVEELLLCVCFTDFVPPCANFYFFGVRVLMPWKTRTWTSASSAFDTVRQLASRSSPLVDPVTKNCCVTWNSREYANLGLNLLAY